PEDVTPERMCDWDWMVHRLAELEPAYPPGTTNTYLSYTFGWLLGEVVRRTDARGRPFGQFVREEICEPLEMDSFFIGVPEEEHPRIADLVLAEQVLPLEGTAYFRAAPSQVFFIPGVYNRADIRAACIPATGGISNARSAARFFAMLANTGTLAGT